MICGRNTFLIFSKRLFSAVNNSKSKTCLQKLIFFDIIVSGNMKITLNVYFWKAFNLCQNSHQYPTVYRKCVRGLTLAPKVLIVVASLVSIEQIRQNGTYFDRSDLLNRSIISFWKKWNIYILTSSWKTFTDPHFTFEK